MWRMMQRIQSTTDTALYVLALLMVFPCLGLGLLEPRAQIDSLAGVQGVQVVINIGLSQEGPTKKGIQEKIEEEIREAGLQVLEPLEVDSETYQPSLVLEVAILKKRNSPYVYFIYASFFQPVHLVGGDSSETLGATWQSGRFGEGGLPRIQKDVSKIVKQFLAHHKKANDAKLHIAMD